jgi:hypothetical protein
MPAKNIFQAIDYCDVQAAARFLENPATLTETKGKKLSYLLIML